MSYYDDDNQTLTGDPGFFGLRKVVEFDVREPDYSFDTIIVFYHDDREQYYWAYDSGCSCPMPFEDFYLHVRSDQDSEEVKENIDNFLKTQLSSGNVSEMLVWIARRVDLEDSDYCRKEFLNAVEAIVDNEKEDNYL